MWRLGATEQSGGVDALADGLIQGLTARATAVGIPALKTGVDEIRRRCDGPAVPIGMYRLAEVLNPGPVPPAPRQPIGDLAAAVDCVRRHSSTVLDAADPAAVAGVLGALITNGLRLLVTGQNREELTAIRAALPADVAGLCLEGPQPLSATELRELRALLVTSTPERARRARQVLPEPGQVPDPDLVARLCKAAGRPGYPPRNAAELIPELLGEFNANRLNALIETARQCDVAVSALNRDGTAPWSWELLESLLFGQSRRIFERLLVRCGDTMKAADGLRDAGDQLALIGTIDAEGLEHLRRYADFLDAGGKPRSYFRSPEQRAVEPVLRQLRLDGAPVKDSTILRHALAFIELISQVDQVAEDCELLDLPVPTDIPGVIRLRRELEVVAEAVLAVEILRHEVLFIHPSSPVSMPDMEATEAVARAIINAGSAAEMEAARERLAEMADAFASTLPARLYAETVEVDMFAPSGMFDTGSAGQHDADDEDKHEDQPAPEYLAAVQALKDTRLPDYLEALRALSAARRERIEQLRLDELLNRLRTVAPGLADAWQRTGGHTFAPGTVRFQTVHELLAELPDADTSDVVVLVGADRLDPGYLAVAAAAPRLLVASAGAPVPPASEASVSPDLSVRMGADGESVSSMLRRAGIPVIAAAGAREATPGQGGGQGGASGQGGVGAQAGVGGQVSPEQGPSGVEPKAVESTVQTGASAVA